MGRVEEESVELIRFDSDQVAIRPSQPRSRNRFIKLMAALEEWPVPRAARDLVVAVARCRQPCPGHRPRHRRAVVGSRPEQGRVIRRDQNPPLIITTQAQLGRARRCRWSIRSSASTLASWRPSWLASSGASTCTQTMSWSRGPRSHIGPWPHNRYRGSPVAPGTSIRVQPAS